MEIISEKYTGIRVVKNEAGKFCLQECIDGEWESQAYRYRTLEMAEKIAQQISDENDRLNTYVEEHS